MPTNNHNFSQPTEGQTPWTQDWHDNFESLDTLLQGMSADGTSLSGLSSIDTDDATITKLQNGRWAINAADPSGILAAGNIADKINDAFSIFDTEFSGGGRVIVPQPSDGSYYNAGTTQISFIRTTPMPDLVGVGRSYIRWSGMTSNPITVPPASDGTGVRGGAIRNLRLGADSQSSYDHTVQINDTTQFTIDNCSLTGPSNVAGIHLDEPQSGAGNSNVFKDTLVTDGPEAIRLGNASSPHGTNNNEIRSCFLGGNLVIYGDDNYVSPGTHFGAGADVGVDIYGQRNKVYPRLEAPYGDPNAQGVVVPVKTRPSATDNKIDVNNPEAVWHMELEGVRNNVESSIRTEIHSEYGAGADFSKNHKWLVNGAASANYRARNVRLTTNGAGSSEVEIISNSGQPFARNGDHPALQAEVQPAHATQLTIEMGLYQDASNYHRFTYDAGSSESTWVAETNDGGTVATDTTSFGGTTPRLAQIRCCGDNGQTIRYVMDGEFVAEHTVSDNKDIRAQYRLAEKEASAKYFRIFSHRVSSDKEMAAVGTSP